MSVLTKSQRLSLPDSAFALPDERKYPINDQNHAKIALFMVNKYGTPQEKMRVQNAIYNTWGSLKKQKGE